MITELEAVKIVEREYPDHTAELVADHDGKYYVNIVQNGDSDSLADFHMVDKSTGEVSGNIPFGKILEIPQVLEQINDGLKKKNGISEYLAHYGIKGQKWGERNGPPYPLDSKTHNEVVKKADSSEGSKSPSKESASFNSKNQSSILVNKSGSIPPEAVFVATSVAATLLKFGIQIGIAKLIASRAKKNFVKKSEADNERISKEVMGEYADIKQFSDSNPPKKISGKHSIEDDAKAVNPMFNESVAHTATNCVLCTATYDLRRRGYDVTSKMCKTGSLVENIINSVYKGKTKAVITSKAKNWDDVLDAGKYNIPDGSRGFFSINSSRIGMGHCMAFEVENGKFRIVDSQCANTNVDIKSDKYKIFDPNRTLIVRTDHLSVNMKGVGLTSAELKDGWKTKVPKSNKRAAKTDGYKQYIEQYKKDHPDTKLSDDEIGKNYSVSK